VPVPVTDLITEDAVICDADEAQTVFGRRTQIELMFETMQAAANRINKRLGPAYTPGLAAAYASTQHES
jgi:hypothetical protein